jgi:hypothetical protein
MKSQDYIFIIELHNITTSIFHFVISENDNMVKYNINSSLSYNQRP